MGLFWNIRGLDKIERLPAQTNRIRSTRGGFVGVMKTKEPCTPGYPKCLTGNIPFDWFYLPTNRSAGDILVSCNSDKFTAILCSTLDFFCESDYPG